MKQAIIKRGMAVLLALVICAGLLPFSAFADEGESDNSAPAEPESAPIIEAVVQDTAPVAPEIPAVAEEEAVTAAVESEAPANNTESAPEIIEAESVTEYSPADETSEISAKEEAASESAEEFIYEEEPEAEIDEEIKSEIISEEIEEMPADAPVKTVSDEIVEEATENDDADESVNNDPETEGEAVSEEVENSEEEAPVEDEDGSREEVAMPAVSFSRYANGIYVSIKAPEGAFPEGTTMQLTAVNGHGITDLISGSVEGNVSEIKAVDISFWYNGTEIEPLAEISVFMCTSEISGDAQVIHIDDSMNVDSVASANGGAASFMSGSFSIYALVVVKASAPWEQENLTRASEVSELDGKGFYISSTANNKDNINKSNYYFTNDIISWNKIAGGIKKTQANDITSAEVFYFKQLEGESDQYLIYWLDENSEAHYIKLAGGKNIGFTDAEDATAFTVKSSGDGFSIGADGLYFNLQGKDSGLGFQASSADVINLTSADKNIDEDPYGLNGHSFGIVYTSKNNSGSTSMTDSFAAETVNVYENESASLIVENENATSLWTFESSGSGKYFIKSGSRYLKINSGSLTLTDDPEEASEISVTPATANEAYEGRYRLSISDPATGKTLAIRYNDGRFTVGNNVNSYNEWFYLADAETGEKSEEIKEIEYSVEYHIVQAPAVSGMVLNSELPVINGDTSGKISAEAAENYSVLGLNRSSYQCVKTSGSASHFPYITYQFAGWTAENGSLVKAGSIVNLKDYDVNGDGIIEFTTNWRYKYEEGTGYPTANFTIWRNISSADSSINSNTSLGEQTVSYTPAVGSAIMYAYDSNGNEVWVSPSNGGNGNENTGNYYQDHAQKAEGKYMLITYVDSSIDNADAQVRALTGNGISSSDSNTGSVTWKLSSLPSDESVLSSLAEMVRNGATTLFDENGESIAADELTTDNFFVSWCQVKYQSGRQDGWNINAKLTRKAAPVTYVEDSAEDEAVEDVAEVVESTEIPEDAATADEKLSEEPVAVIEEKSSKVTEPSDIIKEVKTEEPAGNNDTAPVVINTPVLNPVEEANHEATVSIEGAEDDSVSDDSSTTVSVPNTHTISYKPAAISVEPIEYIDDEIVPLAAVEANSEWALMNLIVAVITCAVAVIMLIRRHYHEDKNGNERVEYLAIIPAIAAAALFIVTEDMSTKMVITDKWTIAMLICLIAAMTISHFSSKKAEEEA